MMNNIDLINKIYLEDCYSLMEKIEDNSIDLIMTDPPYLIEERNGAIKGKFSKSFQSINDSLNDSDIISGIDNKYLDQMVRIMKNINIYIWCNKAQIINYFDYFVKGWGCGFDIIIWSKKNGLPSTSYRYETAEYCLYFRKGGYCKPTSVKAGKVIYNLPSNIMDKKKYYHPTIKPLSIIKTLIGNSTIEGDLVFDPFMGSGTTAIASLELKRNYLGSEMNPKFYKTCIQRINDIINQQKLYE